MSRGGGSVFAALMTLFLGAFTFLSVIRIFGAFLFPDESIKESGDFLWRVFLQISDAGAVAEDGESNWFNKVVGILSVFSGLVLFSSLVAFITNQFDQKIQELRKGKSEVLESNHTLILGFGIRTIEILRELIEANSSESGKAAVILADQDKEEMDDFLSENLEDTKTTKIITRSGLPSHLNSLKRVNASKAKSIIILNPSGSEESEEGKSIGDAKVLKSIMALVALNGESGLPPIVAELHGLENRNIASDLSDSVQVMDERSILSKLLVQTSRTSGLAIVYSNLVGFEGNEIYFYKPKNGWRGLNYSEISFRFKESVPLGFRKITGEIVLNPDPEYSPENEEDAIILAEDDSKIKFDDKPIVVTAALSYPNTSLSRPIDKQLIVGWNSKSKIIVDEYAKFSSPDSEIDLLINESNEEIKSTLAKLKTKYPQIKLRSLIANLSQEGILEKLSPEQYDSVIFLAEEKENIEEVDARTISLLLRFRQYFKKKHQAGGKKAETQLITEIMNSENTELVLETGVKDFLISNQFVSKMMAQVSQEPDVMRVYDSLFDPEGSEIYLKPAFLYFEDFPKQVNFADCMLAAQQRKETCFGVRIVSEETDESKGYGVYLIPDKLEFFTLHESDSLIVLSEDQS
ncbi:CASTOR/POLLUX-related putative ion channel [Leptospira sp. SA-E8]|uniref:CASTOR/POLLUX-related putative ion channel n=1 Tax=Leptospira sp. SA-E8 TaxID=3422259 RepID=UPI003EB9182F